MSGRSGMSTSSSSSRNRNSSWSDLADRVERRRSRSDESFHERLADRLDHEEQDDEYMHTHGHVASSPPARRARRQQHRGGSLGSNDDAPNCVRSTQVHVGTSDHPPFGLARPPVRRLRTNRGVGSRRTCSHTTSQQKQRRGSAGGGDGSLSASALAAAAAFAGEHSLGEKERRRSGTRLGLGLGLGLGGAVSGGDLSAMGMGGGEDILPPVTISVPVVQHEQEQQQQQAGGAEGAVEGGKEEGNDGEANNLTMSLERSSNHDSMPSVASSSANRSTRSMSRNNSQCGGKNLAQPTNRQASASDTSSAGGGRSSRRSSAARQGMERRRSSAKYGISVVDKIKLDLGSAANSSYSDDDDHHDGDDDGDDGDDDDDASLDEQALADASASDRQLSAANTNSGSHHSIGIGRREGTASKRGSFAQEALSSLVAVFQSSKGTLDVDGLAGSSDDDDDDDGNPSGSPTDARSHGSAGGASRAANSVDAAVDALVITDDEDDDEGHDHDDDDDAVPAPIPLDGQRPTGMPRSTVLGSGNKKFLPGASVRRHGSKATAADTKDGGAAGGHHSLGAYGAGAAEAAESAARAAAEFVTDADGVVSPRKRGMRGGSRAAEGGDDDNDDANADGMQVDFPSERRRGSWNGHPASMQQRMSSRKMKRHGSYTSSAYSSTDSLASSIYEQNTPAQVNKPTTAPPGGGQSMVFGGSGADNEPIESVPEGEVGDESGSDDDHSKSDNASSSSSDSVSIASDDICDDPDPPTLVAKGFVPCSFVADAQNSSNIKLNMYESSQNLDYTTSGLTQEDNNDSSGRALTTFNPAYLDAEMAAGIQGGKLLPAISAKFAAEHCLFIRAVLQLLGERDRVGVEANMDDPHTIKSGSLKKSSSNLPGVWKVKFVEIRRGIFSYYEDKPSASGGDSLLRRNIPLRSSLCTCRAVKLRYPSLDVGPRPSLFGGGPKNSGGGYVFELSVQGGRRRLWMASSKEERQAWIRAIHEAMIGVSQTAPRRDSGNSRHPLLPWIAPPKDDCDQYLKIQAATKAATSEAAYISAVTPVWNTTLCIPVQRIREQAETVATFDNPDNSRHHEARTRLQIFWDDLSHNSLSLNGHTLLGEHKYGPERMVGALTRCILEYDRLANEKDAAAPDRRTGNFRRASTVSSSAAEQMTEVQAIGYARDILLGCNRSGSGRDDDSFYSVETLFGNNDFAVLIPSSQMEPVSVDVSNVNADDDKVTGLLKNNNTRGGNSFERSGWVDYRNKSSKKWKRRYCVLSEGVISIYENGYPRPHGLRDQLVLVGAAISTTGGTTHGDEMDDDDAKSGDESKQSSPERSVRKHAVFIKIRDTSKPKHYVAFENRAEMMGWAEAIRSSIETCSPEGIVTDISMSEGGSSFNETDVSIEGKKGLLSTFRPPFMGGRSGAITPPDESRGGLFGNIRKGGKSSDDTSIRAPPQDDPNSSKRNKFFRNPKRAPSTGSIMAALEADKYPDATVRISVQSSTMYKLCTSNPDGDENQDTWGMVRTKLLRNYLLAGGPNGRMIRGEDIVELEFLKGIVREETFHLIFSKKEDLANIGEIIASRK